MKTLAERLGIRDPRKPEGPGEPKEVISFPKLTVKSFCKMVLESEEYRQSVFRRVLTDELPPAIESLMYQYAYGKPVEKVEITDTTKAADNMTPAQIEQRLESLKQVARRLRTDDAERATSEEDEAPASAVH